MTAKIYNGFLSCRREGQKKFAMLIDPDKVTTDSLLRSLDRAVSARVDFLFLGGSLLMQDTLAECVSVIKTSCDIPVILFPGSCLQINADADAIFFLSLISGRNADLLIGQHVIAAPMIRSTKLEVLPTGYLLVDGGAPTTVSYMSGTQPIPADKNDIAACTAMAGEMLGLKLIYMDAGSGARQPIPEKMIRAVRESINIPIIAGGGITTPQKAKTACEAGADIIVVGNAIERDENLISQMADSIHSVASV